MLLYHILRHFKHIAVEADVGLVLKPCDLFSDDLAIPLQGHRKHFWEVIVLFALPVVLVPTRTPTAYNQKIEEKCSTESKRSCTTMYM